MIESHNCGDGSMPTAATTSMVSKTHRIADEVADGIAAAERQVPLGFTPLQL